MKVIFQVYIIIQQFNQQSLASTLCPVLGVGIRYWYCPTHTSLGHVTFQHLSASLQLWLWSLSLAPGATLPARRLWWRVIMPIPVIYLPAAFSMTAGNWWTQTPFSYHLWMGKLWSCIMLSLLEFSSQIRLHLSIITGLKTTFLNLVLSFYLNHTFSTLLLSM